MLCSTPEDTLSLHYRHHVSTLRALKIGKIVLLSQLEILVSYP